MVYHYTTIDALFNILASYKASEDKDHFTFWASNALDQNDSTELSLTYKDLFNAICKVEEEKEQQGENLSINKLSTAISLSSLRGKDDIEDEINSSVKDHSHTPFTMSFSREKDSLLMWSIYANKGNGVCLVYDENEFQTLNTNNNMTNIQGDVIYSKEVERYIDWVRLHYDEYLNALNNDDLPIANNVANEGYYACKTMFEFISPFIKNKAFEGENEWRIVFFQKSGTQEYTRLSANLNKIHYVKVGIPLAALKKIIIGPCADYNKVKDLLIQETTQCGIREMSNPDFYIQSEVPYRII